MDNCTDKHTDNHTDNTTDNCTDNRWDIWMVTIQISWMQKEKRVHDGFFHKNEKSEQTEDLETDINNGILKT